VALGAAQRLPVRWAIDELLSVAIQQLRGARSALADATTLPTARARGRLAALVEA
jgi:hypothetical protein